MDDEAQVCNITSNDCATEQSEHATSLSEEQLPVHSELHAVKIEDCDNDNNDNSVIDRNSSGVAVTDSCSEPLCMAVDNGRTEILYYHDEDNDNNSICSSTLINCSEPACTAGGCGTEIACHIEGDSSLNTSSRLNDTEPASSEIGIAAKDAEIDPKCFTLFDTGEGDDGTAQSLQFTHTADKSNAEPVSSDVSVVVGDDENEHCGFNTAENEGCHAQLTRHASDDSWNVVDCGNESQRSLQYHEHNEATPVGVDDSGSNSDVGRGQLFTASSPELTRESVSTVHCDKDDCNQRLLHSRESTHDDNTSNSDLGRGQCFTVESSHSQCSTSSLQDAFRLFLKKRQVSKL